MYLRYSAPEPGDDGEVVVMDHRVPGGGFAALAVQGALGVDDVFGHAQPDNAVGHPALPGDRGVTVLGRQVIAEEPRPPGPGARDQRLARRQM